MSFERCVLGADLGWGVDEAQDLGRGGLTAGAGCLGPKAGRQEKGHQFPAGSMRMYGSLALFLSLLTSGFCFYPNLHFHSHYLVVTISYIYKVMIPRDNGVWKWKRNYLGISSVKHLAGGRR
jgi:hypothetical protein